MGYIVKKIDSKDAMEIITTKHYLRRKPSISWAFGLFKEDGLTDLVGICTIGKPASNSLCKGVMGGYRPEKVYELNRLFTYDELPKNTLSYFVGKVLNILKQEDILLVSYADTKMNHHGYIYQATNWLYTGQTKSRTDMYTEGGHSRHYDKESNTKHLRKVRSSKYRYIYICGGKNTKKDYMSHLKYPIIEKYPKGKNDKYDVDNYQNKDLIYNKITDKYFFN